jgi:hypothetical protein
MKRRFLRRRYGALPPRTKFAARGIAQAIWKNNLERARLSGQPRLFLILACRMRQ